MSRPIIWVVLVILYVSPALSKQYSLQELKAALVFAPKPEYTYKLRQMHLGGSGIFRLFFDEKGKVTTVKTVQTAGHPELDAEAVKAFMRWRTRPGPQREADVPVTFDPSRIRIL